MEPTCFGAVVVGKRRYATRDGLAFVGEEHAPDCWHGWPAGWQEVPEPIRRAWLNEGRIRRRDIQRFWEGP